MSWLSQYIGKPWVDKGRDFRGFDCWGLVYLAFKSECKIVLPSYGEISAHELMRVTSTIKHEANYDPWVEVHRNDLKEFDVALLRGRPLHVGLITKDKRLLHVEENTATVCVPLLHPSVAFRLIGFRRHKDLMHAS